MSVLIKGTPYADTIRQNGYIEVEVYAYGGNDLIVLNRIDSYGGFNYVDAGSGNDTVRNSFEGGNDIFLGAGNDYYYHSGAAKLAGENDVVSGGGGNDIFEVKTLTSVYYGDTGNDTFYSVGYNNAFDGGAGIDTISYSLQDSVAGERGRGVYADLGLGFAKTTEGRLEELRGIENVTGTNAADTLIGTGGANVVRGLAGWDRLEGFGGNDKLYGGGGGDDLFGDAGHDDLYGDAGNDRLYGGTGDDDLVGGAGNDLLVGGAGNDLLFGGAGADTFRFSAVSDSKVGALRDVIDDFRPGSERDKIDLIDIDANVNTGRNDAFTFIGKAAFSGAAGELRYSGTVISGDVNGDGRADFQIDAGLSAYYGSDFLL